MKFYTKIFIILFILIISSCNIFFSLTDDSLLGGLELSVHPKQISSIDNYLYVPAEKNLYIIDVTNPINPNIANIYTASYSHHSTAVYNDHAYIIGGTAIEYLNISNKISPYIEAPESSVPYTDIYTYNDYLYAIRGADQLKIRSCSLNTDITALFSLSHNVYNVIADDNYTYMTTPSGLSIYDTIDKASPSIITSLALSTNSSSDLVQNDNILYVTNADSVHIINITDRNNPVKVGSYSYNSNGSEIYRSDDYLFLIGGNQNNSYIEIVNISSASTLENEREIFFGVNIEYFYYFNGMGYIFSGTKLWIVDLSKY